MMLYYLEAMLINICINIFKCFKRFLFSSFCLSSFLEKCRVSEKRVWGREIDVPYACLVIRCTQQPALGPGKSQESANASGSPTYVLRLQTLWRSGALIWSWVRSPQVWMWWPSDMGCQWPTLICHDTNLWNIFIQSVVCRTHRYGKLIIPWFAVKGSTAR